MTEISHRSPSFTAIYNSVKSHSKHHILDLCSCEVPNFRFFSQLGCRFHFLGLNEDIQKLTESSIQDFGAYLDTCFSSFDKSRKFDIVLAWDVLNFLNAEKLTLLFSKLDEFLHLNALFHYYAYASKKRLAQPSLFHIKDQYHVGIKRSAYTDKVSQFPNTTYLLKSLNNYYMWHSYNGLDGMTVGLSEHILCYQPDVRLRKSRASSAELKDAEHLVDRKLYSPSLENLRLRPRGGSILDLSRKSLLNEDQWMRRFDDVVYEDLQPSLRRYEQFDDTDKKSFLREGVLVSYPENTIFDTVILWDLADFIERDFLLALNKRIAEHCDESTTLIVMSHVGSLVPSHPLSFILTQEGLGLSQRDIPRFVPRKNKARSSFDWQKTFSHFDLKHTFAVRPGMLKGLTEYVFTFNEQSYKKSSMKDAIAV